MTDGPSRSLIDQLAARLRRPLSLTHRAPGSPGADRHVLIVVALLASIPFSLWAGASWIAADVRAESATLARRLAPWRAALADHARTHGELAALVATPAAAARIDQLARALDEADRIASVARDPDGTIVADILTVDPARLRARLAGIRALPRMRTVAERRGEATLVVRITSK